MQFDMREVIARIVDGSRFHEYQPDYGTTLVCGFAHIWGCKVGILGNNGVLFNDSSLKGAHFMRAVQPEPHAAACSCRTSPASWSAASTRQRGITKDGAKMIMAQCRASRCRSSR